MGDLYFAFLILTALELIIIGYALNGKSERMNSYKKSGGFGFHGGSTSQSKNSKGKSGSYYWEWSFK